MSKAKDLIKYNEFFESVVCGDIKLSNGIDADVFASWKAGGQEFYVYGVMSKNEQSNRTAHAMKTLKDAIKNDDEAARYRWLRDNCHLGAWWSVQEDSGNYATDIDNDIDEAMADKS